MTTIYGNIQVREKIQHIFSQNTLRTLILTGPAHVGKYSFLHQTLCDYYHPIDVHPMQDGVDGVRAALDFCRTEPLHSLSRVILVDGVDGLSEPAQDALLKICEEPHISVTLAMVSSDIDRIQPALRSRMRNVFRFDILSENEMRQFAEDRMSIVHENILNMASGRPGLYSAMVSNAGFEDLYEFVRRCVSGNIVPMLAPVPETIRALKGAGIERDAVAHIVRIAARQSTGSSQYLALLDFCSTIIHCVSANAEIHWLRAAARLSSVVLN